KSMPFLIAQAQSRSTFETRSLTLLSPRGTTYARVMSAGLESSTTWKRPFNGGVCLQAARSSTACKPQSTSALVLKRRLSYSSHEPMRALPFRAAWLAVLLAAASVARAALAIPACPPGQHVVFGNGQQPGGSCEPDVAPSAVPQASAAPTAPSSAKG